MTEWRTRNQRAGLREVALVPLPRSPVTGRFKVVQGRSRQTGSLDSRNARNKLVPSSPTFDAACWKEGKPRSGCVAENASSALLFCFISLPPLDRQSRRATAYLLGVRPGHILFILQQIGARGATGDKIEGLRSICFFVAPPRRVIFPRFLSEFFTRFILFPAVFSDVLRLFWSSFITL